MKLQQLKCITELINKKHQIVLYVLAQMHNTQIIILILLLYASFKGFLYASFVEVLRLSHKGLPRSSTAIPQRTPELVSLWHAF